MCCRQGKKGKSLRRSFMQLTEEQRHIVKHCTGHARISAVAGSGKTTTMVARIGHLLKQGVAADEIMVLMFNRSARDGFEAAMQKHLGGLGCKMPEIRTFHSLGLRLVNSFTKRGVLEGRKLVTEEFVGEKLAKQAANSVYQRWADEDGYLGGEDIEEFLAFIDRVKATVEDAGVLFKELSLPQRLGFFPSAYELFEKLRKQQRIRFYNDLVHEPVEVLQNDPKLADWVANRVEHIIVDEYQDINETQQLLLKCIAGSRANVMVVGDVDQCIYEWRGAKPEYITTRFDLDFPDPALYKLTYTFRYGHQLSLAANHLIANNKKRDRKLCISHSATNATKVLAVQDSTKHPLVKEVEAWLSHGRSLTEVAVLFRLYGSSVPVELALLEADIPYRLEGAADIFDSSEISALLGYLKVVSARMETEPEDNRKKVLMAMFSQPHLGIRKEEMEKLVAVVAATPDAAPQILHQWSEKGYPPFIQRRIQEAAENWEWVQKRKSSQGAGPLLKRIVNKLELYEFYDSFAVRVATAENRVKACEALINFASSNSLTVTGLLQRIDELCGRHESNKQQEVARLLLTSVHRAKGLEWPFVVLPGLEEGSFPFYRDHDQEVELEDERRLFYVAITRAKERVMCIHPPDSSLAKSLAGRSGKVPWDRGAASRFLYEANLGLSVTLGEMLDDEEKHKDIAVSCTAGDVEVAGSYLRVIGSKVELVADTKKKSRKKNKKTPQQSAVKKFSGPYLEMSEIAEGMHVAHQHFGAGIVTAVNDRKQKRITVFFQEQGERVLLVDYAKLVADPTGL